jgi:hypothetical protein
MGPCLRLVRQAGGRSGVPRCCSSARPAGDCLPGPGRTTAPPRFAGQVARDGWATPEAWRPGSPQRTHALFRRRLLQRCKRGRPRPIKPADLSFENDKIAASPGASTAVNGRSPQALRWIPEAQPARLDKAPYGTEPPGGLRGGRPSHPRGLRAVLHQVDFRPVG